MKKITDFIVDHCYVVFAIMLALAGVSAFLATKVNINHDLMKYMPADSETAQGLDVMDEEFGDVATSDLTLMFENLNDSQEIEISKYLEGVENVKSVSHDSSEKYIREKDGTKYYLYSLTVNGEADSEVAANVYHTIDDHFRDSEFTYYDKGDVKSSNGEVLNIAIILIAVGSALLVIWIMSDSNIEPLLYLAAILLAVVINKGTNIIFPSISHVTDSICAILQMALSMDYSIMLAARYRQEREKESDKIKAMKTALKDSFSAISASSVTTIVGLIVLVAMSFTIGRDMGLVLSKGVLLSLVSIFTTLPCMLLVCDKLIHKSKKRAPKLKMDWLGRFAHFVRLAAVPVFAIVFVASALLKGNVGIEYTSAANDKIKDIFDENNQIAIIYDNNDEEKMAELCHKYETNEKTAEVLCYGNTIGEPKTYDALVAKAKDLGSDIEIDDYLLRIIYYHYSHQDETHVITLPDFVAFLQDDVLKDENFASDVSDSERHDIDRLANFTTNSMYTERNLTYLANLLDMDKNALKDIFVLYGANVSNSKLGRETTNTKMTLPQFVNFMNGTVLKNATYAGKISNSSKFQLQKLAKFTNAKELQTPSDAKVLADKFGISAEQVSKILDYAAFLNATKNLTSDERATVYAIVTTPALLTAGKMLPLDFANFVLARANDPMLKGQISSDAKSQLVLAQTVMKNVIASTKFDSNSLAQTFSLDRTQLRLLYSLYNINYQDKNPTLSPKNLLNFLNSDILPNVDYNSKISATQRTKLVTVRSLMLAAESRKTYDHKSLYEALSLLSSNLDSTLVDLLFVYHGSKTDFDEKQALTLEQFVNFLSDKVLTDKRFDRKIDDVKRQQAQDAKADVADAKAMLVGEHHSRAVLETTLAEEGDETFGFIAELRDILNTRGIRAYMVGNSPMAYEMSKTFGDEMTFITILTMAAIFIVVALTFKSVLVPLIMVILIQSAVWVTMSILSFTGSSVYFIALIIVQAILMGATIDYAILYTSYFLEHRKRGIALKTALIESYNKSIHAILTSASVLIIVTFIVGNFSSASAIASKICITISQGTACAALLILFILPAVLAAADKIIIRKK